MEGTKRSNAVQRCCVMLLNYGYGWMPHNASFGFLDIARPTLGKIHF
jgi:hypothetical protein